MQEKENEFDLCPFGINGTARLTIETAENILHKPFYVLDHGFVRLIDYMGGDESIVQAARVSYGRGTKKISEDKGLIRYLMRHRHTTPFEMVELKFHAKMPIFVARQWIRHRTACLAEGTEIYFDLPGGIKRRGNQLYKIKIEEIYSRFQSTINRSRPDKQRNQFYKKEQIQKMLLRQINGDTLEIQHSRIVDVYKNGIKPVFKITLADGKEILCTKDHKFFFSDGWNTLHVATGLEEINGKAVWNNENKFIYANGFQILEPKNDGGFKKSHKPWNFGKNYKLGSRKISDKFLEAIKKARSGETSNFWKGGLSTERESIGRWTTQIAHKIHTKNNWTCQLCHKRSNQLHCHHILPVWTDITLARSEDNLTTVCIDCHKKINNHELEYVIKLNGPPIKSEWIKKPRIAWNKLTKAKLVKIISIEFVGYEETYDIEVEGPYHNFIANGIVTHNSVNEYSARYSILDKEFYLPSPENLGTQSKKNRQGRGEVVSIKEAKIILEMLKQDALTAYSHYEYLLNEDSENPGSPKDPNRSMLARELARMHLSLNFYTQWYWKIDLHNLFHFLSLRMDAHAQYEIRIYADKMAEITKAVAPIAYEAFEDYRLYGTNLSKLEKEILMSAINKEELLRLVSNSGLSTREKKEFVYKFGLE